MKQSDARAKEVFAEALDLPSSERPAALSRLCAGDEVLRGRVERLLVAADVQDDFLREPPALAPAIDPHPADLHNALGSESAGSQVGPYTLTELIGEGGFGSVFAAQQERPLRRRVALKVIKLGMDTRALIARFEQERQSLAVMDHPNICKIFDAGVTAAGRPYFVMEFVQGVPITRHCDERGLGIRERIGLFIQVCGAVQHAHARGIIHRDLKPGNILVEPGDAAPSVKVIDFGIAKAIDKGLEADAYRTEQRALIGTPEYMSPEQAEGSLDLDTRTDVYSLGVVLYELLVGTPPFDARELSRKPRAEMEKVLREVEPVKPSTRISQHQAPGDLAARRGIGPRELAAQVKGELDWIVMRALEKDRLRRYDSPAALAADLTRFLNGEAIHAAPPSRVYAARKFIGRHRAPVIAASLVTAALTLGAVGTTVGLVLARDAQRLAVNEAAAAQRSAAAADSVNNLMSLMVRRADRAKEGGRADVTVREVMDAASRDLLAHPDRHEPIVVARLAETIAATYRELSLFEQAEPLARLAAETRRTLDGESSIPYAQALSNLGSILQNLGKSQAAQIEYSKAEAIATNAGPAGAAVMAALLNDRATMAQTSARLDNARALLEQAKSLLEQAGRTDVPVYARTLQNIASVQFANGELDAAEATFLASRAHEQSLDAESRVAALQNFGALQFSRGKIDQAVKTLEELVALATDLYGPSLPLAEAMKNLAIARSAQGDIDGSIDMHRQVVEMGAKFLPEQSPTLAQMHSDLGASLYTAARWEEAAPQLERAIALLEPALGPGHTEVIISHYRLAIALENTGDFAQAERVLRNVIDVPSEGLKEGGRYEWIRHALRSALGGIRLRAGDMVQAADLIPVAAENLLRLAPMMGSRNRGVVVGAALDRCIALYSTPGATEDDPGREAALTLWKQRKAEFVAPAAR